MAEVVRPYRGVSAEDRRAERRARLLEAGLVVVGRDGLAATTTAAVCQEAGLTKRYLYESFKDLDELLEALLEGLHQRLLGEIHDALAGAGDDVRDRAACTVERLVTAMDDPRMARLYAEAAGHPRLEARREAAYEVYAELVVREVLQLRRPDARARLAGLVFVTGTTQAVVAWIEGKVDLTRDELVDELAALAVARTP